MTMNDAFAPPLPTEDPRCAPGGARVAIAFLPRCTALSARASALRQFTTAHPGMDGAILNMCPGSPTQSLFKNHCLGVSP